MIEPNQQRLGHRRRQRMEAIERPPIADQRRTIRRFEHIPHCPVLQLGVRRPLGMRHTAIHQPGVHLVECLEPQPRREEPLTHQPDLVLDLTLLPT